MATPDDTWDLAQTDAPPPPPPSAAPATAADPMADYIKQQLALLQAPPPSVQPDTTPVKRGFLSLLGEAIGGGPQTDAMSPAQRERAGLRALGDFGTSLMAGSGYYPGKPMFGGLAQGFQGAERSEAGSEQQAASYLGAQQNWQMEQQKLQLLRLKEAMPLLQMQYGASIPNPLLANAPAVPGTAGGAGKPGGGGVAGPLTAYGKGGPAGNVPVPPEYMPLFEAASKRTGVPVDLLIAQARQESGFNPGATGGAGEVGIMQIHPKTATDPGFGLTGVRNPDILRDPGTNINFGADYLAARAKSAGADLSTPEGQAKALQAYNGGGDPNYVANVTRYMPPVAPYKVATAGNTVPGPPSGSTTAPAATPPAPGQTPPAASPAPGGQLTFEQFQAQHPIAINAADYTVTPPGLAEAKAAQAAAAQQLSLARAGRGGDPNKSLSDYNTATQAVNKLQQDAQAKSLELQQAAQKNALDTQRQLYDAEQQRQAQAAIETQKIQAAAAEADKQRQGAIDLENAKAGNQANVKLTNDVNEDIKNSGTRIDDLQLLRGLSDNVGTPTPLTSIKVGGRSLADLISATGFGGQDLRDKAGAVQAFHAGVLSIVRDLRSGGAATGEPRSNQDLEFVTGMAPSEWQDPKTRAAIISFLQQVNQRRVDVGTEYSRQLATKQPNGQPTPAGLALAQARDSLPPMVPPMPANLMAKDPATTQLRQEWFERNVKPGTFFRYPNGHIDLYKGPQ